MPLVKSTLANGLESVFNNNPSSVAEAAQKWAQAYVSYASAAMTSTGGSAVNAMAGLGTLTGAFTGALQAQASPASAGAMAAGVTAFWLSIIWAGPATGVTVSPGNAALATALAAVFSNLGKLSASEKANAIADAFDAGAKLVMVLDTIPGAPPVVVTAPIQ